MRGGGLGLGGRAWRLGVTLVVAVGAVVGTLAQNDRSWPFAPMVMFAFSVDRSGEIHSLGLRAVTVEGDTVTVPLGAGGIGLERAEIEGQASSLIAQPHRLQGVAVAASRRLPDRPRYARVMLVDQVSRLHDGRVVARDDVVRASWRVRDPEHPRDLP